MFLFNSSLSKPVPEPKSVLIELTLASVRPERDPLKATVSLPFPFTEYVGFMVMVTSTELAPASAIVTVPTEPEIPRLFELKLNVIESADAIGAIARAAAINKTDNAILRLAILTTRFSSYDEVFPGLKLGEQRGVRRAAVTLRSFK